MTRLLMISQALMYCRLRGTFPWNIHSCAMVRRLVFHAMSVEHCLLQLTCVIAYVNNLPTKKKIDNISTHDYP
jgi:hypothetical protein